MTVLQPPPDLELPHGAPLRGVLPDVARALGVPLPHLTTAGLDLPRTDRAVVVLVDGLGLHPLAARAGHAPNLRRMLTEAQRAGRTACAGFPTTTSASLAAFGTGRQPGETGLIGFSLRDPRPAAPGASGLINLVQWATTEGEPGPDPRAWQPHPTVFEALAQAGVATTSVGKARFEGSGLTRAALRGAAFAAGDTLERAVAATIQALRQPGLVYLYWGQIDAVGHRLGWSSQEWTAELEAFDAALGSLLRRMAQVAPGVPLVLTADHGMLDVTTRYDAGTDPALLAGVALIGGEPRAPWVYLADPADAPAVADRWRERLGDDAWVLLREEAVAGGLFGPVAERNEWLIGDLVVAMRGSAAVLDSRTQSQAAMSLIGMHGSLTPAEVEIPLLVTTA